MDFVDKALARRLESAEEVPQVRYAEIYQKVRPQIGAAVETVCGGHMIFALMLLTTDDQRPTTGSNPPQLCHPDRSRSERDGGVESLP
jgi:hypothetical protein